MKKKLLIFALIICAFITSGCGIRRTTMENINIYTTAYPIEYIVSSLYGTHSTVNSIYPRGVITSQYELTDIQITEYGKSDLFVFDGLSNKEQEYKNKMYSNNNNLRLIDATSTINEENIEDAIWLNPSNVLTAAINIKKGFDTYISNKYLKNDIAKNYEILNLTVSKLEAKMSVMVDECDNPNIVVSNDALNFLTKYKFVVYSLDSDNSLLEKNTETVKKMIDNGEISYIFMLDENEKNDIIASLEDKVKLVYLNNLDNITEEELKENKDYVSIMNENISLLRAEIYND